MPFPAFPTGHFQLISTKDAIVIYFTYPVLSAGYGVCGKKKGKTVTP